jgi:hypothetical protein
MSNNTWYELRRLTADGSSERLITEVNRPFSASRPGMPRRPIVQATYGPNGRIFFPETHGAEAARPGVAADPSGTDFVSINRDGSDRKVHLTFPFVDEASVSPDGRWILYQEGDNAYLIPFPLAGT